MSSILTGGARLSWHPLERVAKWTEFYRRLEVDTVIGVYDWERGIRQCLRLT